MFRLRPHDRRFSSRASRALGASRARKLGGVESLEKRYVMASDLAFIQGTVFDDLDFDGALDAGEPGLQNVQIRITGMNDLGESVDTTDLTDTNGLYRFNNLRPGTYQLTQVTTPAGYTIADADLGTVTITDEQSEGTVGTVIDTFDDTMQEVEASFTTVNQDSTFSPAAPEALGGERDLFVELTSAAGRITLAANADVPDNLDISTSSGTMGSGRVVWDGADNDAVTLDPTGLGGVDLTANSADRLTLLAGTELGGNITINIYSDAGRVSQATFAIPATDMALATADVSILFASFTAVSGGGADFADVGAIEMILAPSAVADGRVDTVATFGPTQVAGPNAANVSLIDLRLNKTVDNATPTLDETVVWTLTLSNDGPGDATGVTVQDTLPEGVTFVSAAATQGTYTAATGVWAVGALDSGTTVTLQITTAVDSPGAQTNTAEVCAATQADSDSTPCNGVATEDDQSSATITPNVVTGIHLEKLTNGADADTIATAPMAFVGSTVEFTYRVTNTGNVPLSNVQVHDDNGTTDTAVDDFFATYDSGDTDEDDQLDVTETWIFRASRVATEGIYTNLGTVTAAGPDGSPVTDTDPSNHLGVALPLALSKRRFLASSFR